MPRSTSNNAKVAVLRARQLLKDKRYTDALQVCTDELALGTDDPQLRLIAAHSLLAQGRHEGAKKEALQVVRVDPQQAEPHRILADVACARGELGTACEHLERVLDLDPSDQRSRGLLDTLSRPSALPTPQQDPDTVPIPGAVKIKARAASIDRFIERGAQAAGRGLDEESSPALEISDSMIEELPAPPDDDELVADVSDSMMEELPLFDDDGAQELSDSTVDALKASANIVIEQGVNAPAPGLSTLHDSTQQRNEQAERIAGWSPQQGMDTGDGVGQKYQGTLRLPALGEPEEEDAPTMPLLRPSAPPEPQLRLDPLASKPVAHLDRDQPEQESTRRIPRSDEVQVSSKRGRPNQPPKLSSHEDDDFEDFDIEPPSVPLSKPEPQPIPKGAPDVRARKKKQLDPFAMMTGADSASGESATFGSEEAAVFGSEESATFGSEEAAVFGGSGESATFGSEEVSSDGIDLMGMMGGSAGSGDDSMPAIDTSRKRKRRPPSAPVGDEGWEPSEDGGPDDSQSAMELELAAAGLSSGPGGKKKGGRKFLIVFLLLLFGGGGSTGYYLYRNHKIIKGHWKDLRAAIHTGTPKGFDKAKKAADAILAKKKDDPKATAALAMRAAATAIEFGDDRLTEAKKLLKQTKGSDSEWRTAAQGYLSLIDDPASASGYLKKSAEVFPKSAILRYLHGRALAATGELQAGAERYQAALKLQPKYVAAKIQLAVLLGTQSSGYERGTAALSEILRTTPDNVQALIERARLGTKHSKGLSQAEADASRITGPLAEKAGRGQIGWAQLVLAQVARLRGKAASMTAALDAAIKAPPCCDSEYRFELANELIKLYRFNDADKQMRAALALKAKHPQYLQRMARVLLDMEKPGQAADYLRRAPARHIETRLLTGRLHYAKGEYKEAIVLLTQVLAESKGLVEAAIILALAEAKTGKSADAVKRLTALREAHKTNHRIPQALGHVHLLAGEYKRADNALRAAWGINGLDPLTPTLLGWVSVRLHDVPRAQKRFSTALSRRPDFAPAHIGLALLFEKMGTLAAARQQAAKVTAGDQTRAAYQSMLASIALAEGKLAACESALARAEAAGEQAPRIAALRGKLYLAKGNAKQAIVLLTAAKKKLRRDADVVWSLGRAQQAARRSDDAYDSFHAALKIDPGHPMTLLDLGKLAVTDGEYPQAVKRLNSALAQMKKRLQNKTIQALAFSALGYAHLRKKDTGRALTNLQDAIDLDPTAAEPQYHMGMTYDALDRPKKAARYYEEAVKLNAEYYRAYLRAAKAYKKAEDNASALKHAQNYLAKAPANAAGRREATTLIKSLAQ